MDALAMHFQIIIKEAFATNPESGKLILIHLRINIGNRHMSNYTPESRGIRPVCQGRVEPGKEFSVSIPGIQPGLRQKWT